MSFKEFVEGYNKKFIALKLNETSQQRMRAWCVKQGFDISKSFSHESINPKDFDFHITVFYSDNKKFVPNGEIGIEPIMISFNKFELMGKTEKNIPALVVDICNNIANIRKVYEGMGLTDSWPSYKPHLTVSYSYDGSPKLTEVGFPDFDVFVDKIVIKNQAE